MLKKQRTAHKSSRRVFRGRVSKRRDTGVHRRTVAAVTRGARNGQERRPERTMTGHPVLQKATAAERAALLHKLELLLTFGVRIASETNPDRLLQLLAEQTRQILEAERCTVFLYDRKTDELWSKLAHGMESSVIRLPKGEGIVGHVFSTRKTLNITNAYTDPRFSRQFDPQTGFRTKTVLAMPMLKSRAREALGVFEVLNKREGHFTKTDEVLLTVLADHAAVAVENAQLYDNLKQAHQETVFRLALMAEHRDLEDIAAHLRRISVYCAIIADAMGWTPEAVETLRLVAPLHDVGKVAIPDAILRKAWKLSEGELGTVEYRLAWWIERLRITGGAEDRMKDVEAYLEDIRRANRPSSTAMHADLIDRIQSIARQRFIDRDGIEKPLLTDQEVQKLTIRRGNLNPEERIEIQKHTTYGAQILAGADSHLMQVAACIAISHHEKYDGTGYPRGLRGEEIPLDARVVALADVFDALCSKRVYKRGWSLEEVVAYIQDESGKHFDPNVVKAFMTCLPKIRRTMEGLADRMPGERQDDST